MKLTPSPSFKIWGGQWLANKKGIKAPGADPLGETWEVSIHKDGQALFQGQKLGEIITSSELPYLVKFIDTSDNLSIQVHPDNEYAAKHENQMGKTECWFILSAGEGAGLYLGLKEGVTKPQFEEAIAQNKMVNELMNFYPVERGQFFYVPAGSLHAIGKNVTMCEVQQSSGVTYRVWDWNRVDSNGKPRELHVKKAMDVSVFEPEKNRLDYFKFKQNIFNSKGVSTVVEHQDFQVQLWNAQSGESLALKKSKRMVSVIPVEGIFSNEGESVAAYQAALATENIILECQDGGSCLIIS